MKGDWRNPVATDEAIDADGWFRTEEIIYEHPAVRARPPS
jgi:long-subunit acyl-CoA synthetase (AMP-forming)